MSDTGARVDYHVHTAYSHDSAAAPEAILERALETGIDCLCVTDHGTLDGAQALARIAPPEVEVVIGCELDATDGSQILALGVDALHGFDPVVGEDGALAWKHRSLGPGAYAFAVLDVDGDGRDEVLLAGEKPSLLRQP